jgi:GT2 family glycosyltransferase
MSCRDWQKMKSYETIVAWEGEQRSVEQCAGEKTLVSQVTPAPPARDDARSGCRGKEQHRGKPRAHLSVIVPVHNGGTSLLRCLTSLLRSTRVPDEIIVVDDDSTDHSSALAQAFRVRVISLADGPHGPAYARNRGAALATGEILIFVDADVMVHSDTVERIDAEFGATPAIQALFGSYDDSPAAPEVASRFKNLFHHYVHQHSCREARTFWSGCGAIRRDTFLAAGGFAERYREPSVEDIELGIRLHRARLLIRLCPEIQVTHLKHWTLCRLWSSDVFARAIPWTRVILSEQCLSADLNLTWRSRLSAAATWTFVALTTLGLGSLARGDFGLAQLSGICAGMLLTTSATLNAGLYLFFFRRGGLGFAFCAWMLHLAYLLYSSGIFVALLMVRTLCSVALGQRSQPTRRSPVNPTRTPFDVART